MIIFSFFLWSRKFILAIVIFWVFYAYYKGSMEYAPLVAGLARSVAYTATRVQRQASFDRQNNS